MILVDTSIWISHFRNADANLQKLLESGDVSIHPFVIGEFACGGLSNREEILILFQSLPSYSPISLEEYLHFINSYHLAGKGVGFVDVHLLASALLNSDFLWTLDEKLGKTAKKLKIAYSC